jgi:hypothetical protein
MQALAMLIPADLLSAANAVGEALGYGPEAFTIPCSDGETVTHYAGYLANADRFVEILAAAQAGQLPPGADPAVVGPVLAATAFDATTGDDSYGHLTEFLAARGLVRA